MIYPLKFTFKKVGERYEPDTSETIKIYLVKMKLHEVWLNDESGPAEEAHFNVLFLYEFNPYEKIDRRSTVRKEIQGFAEKRPTDDWYKMPGVN